MLHTGHYKTKTICRLTGYKAELLRAWEARHALLEPERTKGGHRVYTQDDLDVLLEIRRRLEDGMVIGELAAIGRAGLLAQARGTEVNAPAVGPDSEGSLAWSADAIVEGALTLDTLAITTALDRAFATASPNEVIEHVITPASVRIGELWASDECTVAGEHLASGLIRARLLRLLGELRSTASATAPEAVFACLPGERHEIGLLIVARRKAQAGWRVAWLGGDVPIADLHRACEQRQPRAVYLSVSLTECFLAQREDLMAFAKRWGSGIDLVLGGTGAPAEDADLVQAGLSLDA